MEPLNAIEELGVIPVLEIPDAAVAVRLMQALVRGGLPCAEVTFRTSAAEAAIERAVGECADVLIGAGTVLSVDQARRAVHAGARFVVAPGFNPDVVDYCLSEQVPVVPGICTPTEIEMALSRGLTTVKFFPAEAMGGVAYLRAIRGPYRGLRLVPTGGISPDNLVDYLALDGVVACGGSWIAPKKLIASGDFQSIEDLAAAAVSIVSRARDKNRAPAQVQKEAAARRSAR